MKVIVVRLLEEVVVVLMAPIHPTLWEANLETATKAMPGVQGKHK